MNLNSSMNSKKTEEREKMKKAQSKKEKKQNKRRIFRDANPKMETVMAICFKNNKPDSVRRQITFCS